MEFIKILKEFFHALLTYLPKFHMKKISSINIFQKQGFTSCVFKNSKEAQTSW